MPLTGKSSRTLGEEIRWSTKKDWIAPGFKPAVLPVTVYKPMHYQLSYPGFDSKKLTLKFSQRIPITRPDLLKDKNKVHVLLSAYGGRAV